MVAFSGGVDSSLVAWLAHSTFDDNALAALGVSASLAPEQRNTAHSIAEYIGIELLEVPTLEGSVPGYIANEGNACFHCKVVLYSTLGDVGRGVLESLPQEGFQPSLVLFNGTNADDLTDPTRVGLVAADQFHVASPLAGLPKSTVRSLARHVGLPNWDWAASPCLRSRLQLGVPADAALLQAVGGAEAAVRRVLQLQASDSMRVRVLLDGTVVEFVCVWRVLLEGGVCVCRKVVVCEFVRCLCMHATNCMKGTTVGLCVRREMMCMMLLMMNAHVAGRTVVEVEEPLLDRARGALPELQAALSGFDFVQGLVALVPFRSGGMAGR